jgi:hypothetical protein
MIDDALRVFKSEEYSRFQSFDNALAGNVKENTTILQIHLYVYL